MHPLRHTHTLSPLFIGDRNSVQECMLEVETTLERERERTVGSKIMRFYEEEEEEKVGYGVVGATTTGCGGAGWGPSPGAYERVFRMARGNAVVVFSASGCCMCHVVKRLLLGLGVGPTVYEVDRLDERAGREIQAVLSRMVVGSAPSSAAAALAEPQPQAAGVPAVFVGGRLLGGVEKVMACHINGSLVPLLKQAGALWL